MILHYFNPGYELSARRRAARYTPPKAVRQLRHDLATLPLYYVAEGEGVLVPEDLPSSLRTAHCRTAIGPGDQLLPWGWAPEVPGADASAEVMRSRASRERSIELWRMIYDESLFGPMTPPRRVSREEELPEGGEWVAKLDFSSSGRGVFLRATPDEQRALLAHRGELFLEPWLDKVSDRGYEFVRHADGRIDFLGVNLFVTGSGTAGGGRYGASLIAPQSVILERVRREDTFPSHDRYVAHLLERLRGLDFYGHTGPFGIDTVVWQDGGRRRLAPSVEINLRRTMGHLSLRLAQRYSRPGGPTYLLDITRPAPTLEGLPLYLTGVPREEGPTPLTPLLPDSRFVACLRPVRPGSADLPLRMEQ